MQYSSTHAFFSSFKACVSYLHQISFGNILNTSAFNLRLDLKGTHTITDVGPSRDRTAADHSTVKTHLDLAITKANLPDMRAVIDEGAEDTTLVCSSATLSTRGLGGTVAGGQTWIGGQTMTVIPRF